MIENEASVKGRVIAELLSHLTNDLQIGKKIKSGELRKRLKEPAWHVPECFNMTNIDMENFSMKLLSLKENPGQDYVILQLHGGGYMGAVRNAYYVFAGLYNDCLLYTSIDKLSIVVTIVFSYIVFHEKLSRKALFGLVLIIGGTLWMVFI